MNFKHPEFLYFLFLMPGLLFLLFYTWRRRRAAFTKLCHLDKISNLFPYSSRVKTLFRMTLISIAALMIILALISPRWGYEWKEVETKGSNIIVALDVSKSMLAQDISPSRLTRAKFEITKLVDKLAGDRIGLIVFAGESFLQSPLTHDYLLVKEWLSSISENSVAVPGTSIKSAISTARKAFSPIESGSKALIIISDGEEHDEATIDEARKAKSEEISIFAIGVGTKEGSPIETSLGLVKDKKGNIVVSKLDDALLKEVSQASEGAYVRSTTGDFHLDQLYYEKLKGQSQDEVLKSGKTKKWFETFQIFGAVAFAALVFELLLGFNFGLFAGLSSLFSSLARTLFKTKSKSIFRLLIIAFMSLNQVQPASANIFDPKLWASDIDLQNSNFAEAKEGYLKIQVKEPYNPRLNYNLGIAYYKEANYQAAQSAFARASQNAKTASLQKEAFYNLGNSFFMQENYQDAVNAYENALKIDPEDKDAKHNLELAKKKQQEEENKSCDNPKDDGKGDQNKDQDKKDQDGDQKEEGQDDKKEDGEEQRDQEQKQQEQGQNQDKKDQSQQKQQQRKRPEPKPGELSQQDINRLLRQVEEADPAKVQQMLMQKQGQQRKQNKDQLNPW